MFNPRKSAPSPRQCHESEDFYIAFLLTRNDELPPQTPEWNHNRRIQETLIFTHQNRSPGLLISILSRKIGDKT